jgi:hypothetical protein
MVSTQWIGREQLHTHTGRMLKQNTRTFKKQKAPVEGSTRAFAAR